MTKGFKHFQPKQFCDSEICRVFIVFVFKTLLTPLLCEEALCVLHSGELLVGGKEVSQPWVGKRKGCFGEAFA